MKAAAVLLVIASVIAFHACQKDQSNIPSTSSQGTSPSEDAARHRGNSLIYPRNSTINGKSYAQWAEEFFEWQYAFDCNHFSYADATGAMQNQNQHGPVFFLGGSRRVTIARDVTVPHHVSLFVPIIYYYADDCSLAPGGHLVDSARLYSSYMDQLLLTIDGVTQDADDYYTVTHEFDALTNPDLPNCIGDPCFDGTRHDVAMGGYWVILKPLSPGTHTIHTVGGATCPVCPPGVKDVTWTIHQQ